MFYAYELTPTDSTDDAVYTETTDDGTTYYALGNLYYSSEDYNSSDYYTTLKSGGDNTVSVYVDQVGGYGNLLVSGVYLADESGNKLYFLSSAEDATDDTYYVIIDSTTYAVVTLIDSDGNTVREVTDSDLDVTTETGLYISYTDSDADATDSSDTYLIPKDLYTLTVTFYHDIDGDGESDMLGTASAENVRIVPSETTTVTGDTLEVTVDAELDDDVNITYYTVSVSTADELINALALDGATVTLTSDLTLSTSDYLYVYGTTTIDLNGYTISNISNSANYGLILQEDSDVTITGGTIESMYPIFVNGDNVTLVIEDGTYTSTTTSNGSYYVVYISPSVEGAEVTINGGTFTADDYIGLYAGSGTVTINDGTFEGAYNLYINQSSVSPTLNINGGTFNGEYYAFTINGQTTSENDVTVNITGGDFNGLVYLAGYADTTISGGDFYNDEMQALHVRSGSLTVTGGTFKGTHPDDGYEYEYIYASGGSVALYGDIVVEALSGYPLLSLVVAESTDGSLSLQDGDYYGIQYYLDPSYSSDTPTITVDDDLNYTSHTDLSYRRQVTESGYTSWYLYYSSAEDATATTYTVTIYGTDYTLSLGDLEVQDSSSSTGWSTYSSEE